MQWLRALDIDIFRFINERMSNPIFDHVMPIASGNAFFYPVLVLLCLFLIFRGGARGVLCVLLLVIAVAVCDGWVCKTLKAAIGRERPFMVLDDVRCLIGKGGSFGMPSSHAANWFAATMVTLVYYQRSVLVMLPLALLVSFSRVYNGVHYPSDVLVGAIVGAGVATSVLACANALWRGVGQRWFTVWWEKLPSLLNPPRLGDADIEEEMAVPMSRRTRTTEKPRHVDPDAQWLRLGYIVTAVILVARLLYIKSKTIQLSEDEAYQWLWSKHLALSYYSKPFLIAVTQFLGTSLWGDTAFGVRFFSPIISALLGVMMLRFFAKVVNARAAFFLLLIISATPLLSLGGILMTIDPLSALFWTAAMVAGWHAVQPTGKASDWLWVGLWMGLGLLSKYTALFQLLSWIVLFILWRPARAQLRKPGPYLALLVNALCSLPILIWNAQRHWVTVRHVSENAGVGQAWKIRTLDFIGIEAGVLNPIFFVAMVWAAIVFWKRAKNHPALIYFFSMGAPIFLCYFLWSFRSRILPNWIAPSVVPLFCLMVAYWDTRWRLDSSRLKPWLVTGLTLGFAMVLLAHNTDLIKKLTGYPIGTLVKRTVEFPLIRVPLKWFGIEPHITEVGFDPLHRVRSWTEVANQVGSTREELLSEGKPVFIITDHYGLAGLISFYLPEAKEAVKNTPLVYYKSSDHPRNQFYFWPGYTDRKGENAIYVIELDRANPKPLKAPRAPVAEEFESVSNMGIRYVLYHGETNRPLQFFALRNLK
jgi:membrane-associated phospholipid phosphatase